MRNLLMIAACIFMSLSLSAQQKDVTKFLGIPVDGTKSEMIAKLKAKGFKSSSYDREILEGEFNGKDVTVNVQTNNRKVSRIVIVDNARYDEAQIKIRFNTLCEQFMNNEKYIMLGNPMISDGEDIGYEMAVRDKEYQAHFCQKPVGENGRILDVLELPQQEYSEKSAYKFVWFTIAKNLLGYQIGMYYENRYNMANGEDL